MTTDSPLAFDPGATCELREFDVDYLTVDGQSFLARVYQPAGPGPFPLVLDLHGGAWLGGSRLRDELPDRGLAAAGAVVAAVDFRQARNHPFPAQVQDANYAVRWLKANAAEFNGDPTMVGVMGRSSGGHTMLLNGLRPNDARFAAIPLLEAPEVDASIAFGIAMWAVVDTYARYQHSLKTGSERHSGATERYFLSEEAMHEGSPQEVLDRGEQDQLPVIQVLHGTEDDNVPLSMVERFAESYRGLGGEVVMDVFHGEAHAFATDPGPLMDELVQRMRVFVARQIEARQI